MSRTYKILYLNSEGADFHNIEHHEHPDAFVTNLRLMLGDSVEDVEAFLVGVPEDPKRPWFIENIEVL